LNKILFNILKRKMHEVPDLSINIRKKIQQVLVSKFDGWRIDELKREIHRDLGFDAEDFSKTNGFFSFEELLRSPHLRAHVIIEEHPEGVVYKGKITEAEKKIFHEQQRWKKNSIIKEEKTIRRNQQNNAHFSVKVNQPVNNSLRNHLNTNQGLHGSSFNKNHASSNGIQPVYNIPTNVTGDSKCNYTDDDDCDGFIKSNFSTGPEKNISIKPSNSNLSKKDKSEENLIQLGESPPRIQYFHADFLQMNTANIKPQPSPFDIAESEKVVKSKTHTEKNDVHDAKCRKMDLPFNKKWSQDQLYKLSRLISEAVKYVFPRRLLLVDLFNMIILIEPNIGSLFCDTKAVLDYFDLYCPNVSLRNREDLKTLNLQWMEHSS